MSKRIPSSWLRALLLACVSLGGTGCNTFRDTGAEPAADTAAADTGDLTESDTGTDTTDTTAPSDTTDTSAPPDATDTGDAPQDTADLTDADTASDMDAADTGCTGSESVESCADRGRGFDPETCTCVSLPRCATAGESCDPRAVHDAPWLCVRTDAGPGRCLAECDPVEAECDDEALRCLTFDPVLALADRDYAPISACVPPCAPFDEADTCGEPGDQSWCLPVEQRDGDLVQGACTLAPRGTRSAGEACIAGDLVASCATSDADAPPALCVEGVCRVLCDRGVTASCAEASTACVALPASSSATSPQSWGICVPSCAVTWNTTTDATFCGADRYCSPSFEEEGIGTCVDTSGSAAMHGASCGGDDECADFHVCANGRCTRLCAPDASTGGGACPPRGDGHLMACERLIEPNTGDPRAVGICFETCVIDRISPVGCLDEGLVCMNAALSGSANNACAPLPLSLGGVPLAEGEPCTGLQELDFCKDNGLCLDDGAGGTVCREICDPRRGAFGTTDHPDCTRQAASCTQITNQFGWCQ